MRIPRRLEVDMSHAKFLLSQRATEIRRAAMAKKNAQERREWGADWQGSQHYWAGVWGRAMNHIKKINGYLRAEVARG
jgi:hypothetical protein